MSKFDAGVVEDPKFKMKSREKKKLKTKENIPTHCQQLPVDKSNKLSNLSTSLLPPVGFPLIGATRELPQSRPRTKTSVLTDDSTGSDVFVYRAGRLVPLSSVIKKKETKALMEKENAELLYVYDEGKLVILGGSLCHMDPSQSMNIRARVVLPLGLSTPTKPLTDKVVHNNVQAVFIDETLARFALTALTKPSQLSNKLNRRRRWDNSKLSKYIPRKPIVNSPSTNSISVGNKSNIVDIITAKLALSDDENLNKTAHGKVHKQFSANGKIDISQKTSRNSRLYTKNLSRFPSLSREMKRLDVNFVTIDDPKVCTLFYVYNRDSRVDHRVLR